MPSVEAVAKDYGKKSKIFKEQFFNLSDPVGPGMSNRLGDVMVIQALLNFIWNRSHNEFDMPDSSPLLVTGLFDPRTASAIRHFQNRFAIFLLNPDGRIHPGAYKGRTVKMAASQSQMTITCLNEEAQIATRLKYPDLFYDHITAVTRAYPQLRMFLC